MNKQEALMKIKTLYEALKQKTLKVRGLIADVVKKQGVCMKIKTLCIDRIQAILGFVVLVVVALFVLYSPAPKTFNLVGLVTKWFTKNKTDFVNWVKTGSIADINSTLVFVAIVVVVVVCVWAFLRRRPKTLTLVPASTATPATRVIYGTRIISSFPGVGIFLLIFGVVLYFFAESSPNSVEYAKNALQNFGIKDLTNTRLYVGVGGLLFVVYLFFKGFVGVRRMAGNTLVTVFLLLTGAFVIWVYCPENTFSFLEEWGRSVVLFCVSVAAFAYTKNLADRYNTWTMRYTLALILWLGSAFLFIRSLFNS